MLIYRVIYISSHRNSSQIRCKLLNLKNYAYYYSGQIFCASVEGDKPKDNHYGGLQTQLYVVS